MREKQKNLKPYFLLIATCWLALCAIIYFGCVWAKSAGLAHEMGNGLFVGLVTGLVFGMLGGAMSWAFGFLGLIFAMGIAFHNGLSLFLFFSSIYILSFTLSKAARLCHKELIRMV